MVNGTRLVLLVVAACLVCGGSASAQQSRRSMVDPTIESDAGQLDLGREGGRRATRGRPSCFNPWPRFDPPTPGTCFFNTDIGSFFGLSDGIDFLYAETSGDNDDVLRYGPAPDRALSAHQTSNDVFFAYCPPHVVGSDCIVFIFPGPGAWRGSGHLSVNSAMDRGLNFTCPSTITAQGTVTDPVTGIAHRIVVRQIRTRRPDGTCRDVINDIEVTPER